MVSWNELRKMDSQIIAETWEKEIRAGQEPLKKFKPSKLNDQYLKIRLDIIDLFDNTSIRIFGERSEKNTYGYNFDAEFGLAIYSYLSKLGMTEADAANDDIWRFIQMKVIPDVIYDRWPYKNGKFNNKRFWSDKSRLYLKVIWWYIDLIWAGTEEETKRYMTSLDISQIIDRAGKSGTRIAVYREILHVFSRVDSSERTNLIDRVLMLNSSYCSSIEPELMNCSLEEYVVSLYRELGINV